MSPPRRRSSRLAAAVKTPSKAAPELASLAEEHEIVDTPARRKVKAALEAAFNNTEQPESKPATPVSSAIKPPYSAMHPNHCHSAMHTVAPSSALRLGFTDIRPSNADAFGVPAGVQDTPSKVKMPQTEFTFQDDRAARIMAEIKEQSAKYKATLIAEREKRAAEEVTSQERKIAQPKPKAGRFSAAHMAEFAKMDSIVGHASAWRATRTTPTPVKQGLKRTHSKADLNGTPASIKTNLKRKPSKNTLNGEEAQTPSKTSAPTQIPAKSSLKRSSCIANLDNSEDSTPNKASIPPSAKARMMASSERARPAGFMARMIQKQHERIASNARQITPSLEQSMKKQQPERGSSTVRTLPAGLDLPQLSAKRAKKHQEDDASTTRPISRDGSAIPRPKSSGQGVGSLTHSHSSLARLMSPTKSWMAHGSDHSKPTISLVLSPSKTNLGGLTRPATTTNVASATGGLTKSKTMTNVASPSKAADLRRRIVSPGRLQKVKSILRGHNSDLDGGRRTAIPEPSILTSQTPAPPRSHKELPPLPLTTPRRQLKKVAFTPDTKRCIDMQDSPSPKKSASFMERIAKSTNSPYQSLNGVLTESTTEPTSGEALYPDLSSFKGAAWTPDDKRKSLPKSVPGTFTFRSDKTIDFGTPPAGFGGSPGQSSVRQVRDSIVPKARLPGTFPTAPEPSTHPDKENTAPPFPKMVPGAPHGMTNKKRHRPTWDEEDAEKEAADRAAKKRRNNDVPEGDALVAPRQIQCTPARSAAKKMMAGRALSRTPGSATPSKKGGLSMSRLQMLARPKNRG